MTNHLHLIANADDPFHLKDVIRDFKKFTSKKTVEQIKNEPESRREWMLNLFSYAARKNKRHSGYKLWKSGNHAILLRNEKFIWDKIDYIHNNPVKDGFVNKAKEWKYSSAANYLDEDKENLILPEVICLNRPWETY